MQKPEQTNAAYERLLPKLNILADCDKIAHTKEVPTLWTIRENFFENLDSDAARGQNLEDNKTRSLSS